MKQARFDRYATSKCGKNAQVSAYGRHSWAFGGASLFAIGLVLSGCAQQGMGGMGGKETSGTEIGALVGAGAGAFFGKGVGKVAAILAGAAVGGLIGNRIGASLDEKDRQALADQAKQALLTQPDNTAIRWHSDHSDAAASVTAANTHVETRPVKVVRNATVAPPPPMDLIGANYMAKSATNIRLAPSTDAQIAVVLQPSQPIWAVGKVRGQPWVMVAQHGKSIGYVTASNIVPAAGPATIDVSSASAPGKPAAATTKTSAPAAPPGAFDLDAAAPVRAPADLDSLASDEKADVVTGAVTCRDINTTLTSKGSTEQSKQSVCRSPDGSWDLG